MTALQIRDLPDDIHRALKVRAAQSGQTLSEYVTGLLRRETERPTVAELTERLRLRGQVGTATTEDVVAIIRADRDSH